MEAMFAQKQTELKEICFGLKKLFGNILLSSQDGIKYIKGR